MTHQYDYKWTPFVRGYAFCLAMIGYILWTTPLDDRSLASFIFAIIVLWGNAFIISYLAPVCKVTLTDKELRLVYAYPFFTNQRIDLNEIRAYNETNAAFSSSVGVGKITTTAGKSIQIRSTGTENFNDLSEQLSSLYPTSSLTPNKQNL